MKTEDHEPNEAFRKVLNDAPENLRLLEMEVDVETIKAYTEASKNWADDIYEDEFIAQAKKTILLNQEDETVVKKNLLALANKGSVETYRLIESFLEKELSDDLKKWAFISLQECQVLLEASLTDGETGGLIMSPLGGQDNKIRCYVLVATDSREDLNAFQQMLIKDEFEAACIAFNSLLETVSFVKDYALVKLLFSFDSALDDIVCEAIDACNEEETFLNKNYFATNLSKPTNDEIKDLLVSLREE